MQRSNSIYLLFAHSTSRSNASLSSMANASVFTRRRKGTAEPESSWPMKDTVCLLELGFIPEWTLKFCAFLVKALEVKEDAYDH